jgi:hypothetical protein
MTLPSTTRKSPTYTGNGSLVSYAFTFKVFAAADLRVTIADTGGNESILVLNSSVLVTLNADQDATPGGSVRYAVAGVATALPTGYKLVITGQGLLAEQPTDLPVGGNFDPLQIENALDRLTMLIQQVQELTGRALVFSPSDTAGSALPPAASRASKVIGFDSNGTLVMLSPGGGTATDVETKLLNGASNSEGPGMIVFNPARSYPAGTVGALLAPFKPNLVGDGVTDNFTNLQAVLTAAGASGRAVYIEGVASGLFYRVTDELVVPDNVVVYGDGYASCVKQVTREKNVFRLGNRSELRNIRIQGDGVTSGGVDFLKNNGVVIDTKKNARVMFCWIHGFEFNGILCRNTTGLTIQGNVIFENAYSINAGSDICLYSDVGSIRTVITGNFVLSNNSQGIWVNALGLDTDIAVTNNFACPVDTNGVIITGVSIARRHSFMLGYVGGTDFGGRITCSNNISLCTRQTGVYWQSATPGGGSVTISHNYVRLVGVNALQPALAGGVYLAAQGPSDVVIGNIIEDMPQTGFVTAAGINMQPSGVVSAGNCTLISGNAINNTAGHGIYVGAKSQNVKVTDNEVNGHTQPAYIYVGGGGFTGGGTLEFSGNRSYSPTAAVAGIYISRDVATPKLIIKGNVLNGFNNTTATTANSGIFIRDWDQAYRVEANTLINFYGGVGSDNYANGTTTVPRFLNNEYHSCNAAYHLASVAGAGRLVTEGDVLVGTSTHQSPALLSGSRVVYPGVKLSHTAWQIWHNAVPTTGTWAVGDHIKQSVPAGGQPKGWGCSVAGIAGVATWLSEGNY